MENESLLEGETRSWNGLDEEHLIALGEIVAGAAALENILGITLRNQLKIDPRIGNILVQGLTLNVLIDKISKIAKCQLAGTTVLEELTDWVSEAQGTVKRRNEVIHSAWISNPPPEKLMSVKFAKGALSNMKATHWDPGELTEISAKLNLRCSEMVGFWRRMGFVSGIEGEHAIARSGE